MFRQGQSGDGVENGLKRSQTAGVRLAGRVQDSPKWQWRGLEEVWSCEGEEASKSVGRGA